METPGIFKEKSFWINIAVILLLLAGWQFLFTDQDNLDRVSTFIEQVSGWQPDLHAFSAMAIPRPSSVANILATTPKNGRGGWEFFWYHAQSTLSAAIFGFFIGNLVAYLFAVLLVYIKPLESALMPIFLILRSIPLIAITPLLLRIRYTLADLPAVQESPVLFGLFGTGQTVKMLIVVLIVFFPTLINVHQGLKSVSPAEIELMKSMNASGWQLFWKLRIYSAMPLTFAALKIASASSVLAVTVAEWLGSNRGLGYVMNQGATISLDVRHVWASIIIITGFGLLFYYAVSFVEKKMMPWHESVIALKQDVHLFESDASL